MTRRSINIIALQLFVLACLIGCEPAAPDPRNEAASGSPSDQYFLEPNEAELFEKRATNGDVAAMWRLIDHFGVTRQTKELEHWLRVAVEAGDASAMDRLAALLIVRPDEQKCLEAEKLHMRAIQSATSPAHRAELENSLASLRQGFKGTGSCVAWLNAHRAADG